LRRTDLPTPEMVARLHARSQTYSVGYAVLAGCDLVAAESMEKFSLLPPNSLKSALAFDLTSVTETSRRCDQWLKRQRSDFAAEALREVWEGQLKRDAADVSGIYDLLEVTGAEVARRLAIPLLRRFPACREGTLRLLLAAALRHSDHASLRGLCLRALR